MSNEEALARIHARLDALEFRLNAIQSQAVPQTLDTKGAMQRLGYKSGEGFWKAVRRIGIPHTRISSRRSIFNVSDIDAALKRRQIGNPRARRTWAT